MTFSLPRNLLIPSSRPVRFDEFCRAQGRRLDRELLDGSLTERPPMPVGHESLRVWLQRLLTDFVEARQWGQVYDAATPVEIGPFRARRPDLALVSHACRGIARNGALHGAPDAVIEVVAPMDLRAELSARERDWRLLGVSEIVLIDPVRRQVRAVRRDDSCSQETPPTYTVETLHPGETLCLQTLGGARLPISALIAEMRPPVSDALQVLTASLRQ